MGDTGFPAYLCLSMAIFQLPCGQTFVSGGGGGRLVYVEIARRMGMATTAPSCLLRLGRRVRTPSTSMA